MAHKFSENFKTDVAMNQATLSNSANTPTYFQLENYNNYAFLVFTGARTGAASLTAQARQRIGSAGTQADLGSASTITTANGLTVVEGKAEDMDVDGGNDRVGILITETATANFVVGVVLVRFNARYGQATLPS